MRAFFSSSWIFLFCIALEASHAKHDVEFGRDAFGEEKQKLRGSSMVSQKYSSVPKAKRGLSRNGLRLLRQDALADTRKVSTRRNHEFGRYANKVRRDMGLLQRPVLLFCGMT